MGPCPALEEKGDKFVCGLITNPMVYDMRVALLHGPQAASDAAAYLTGAGYGCDARHNGEPADPEFYSRVFWSQQETRRKRQKSKKIWGMP